MEPFLQLLFYCENLLPGLAMDWTTSNNIHLGIASHLEAGVYMMNVANKLSEDGRELNVFTRSNI